MRVRHSLQALNQFSGQDAPLFLGVSTGDFVIVEAESRVAPKVDGNWWMGQVLFCEEGSQGSDGEHNVSSLRCRRWLHLLGER
jgi:hypothetical protein